MGGPLIQTYVKRRKERVSGVSTAEMNKTMGSLLEAIENRGKSKGASRE